jgi:hypothetical protein
MKLRIPFGMTGLLSICIGEKVDEARNRLVESVLRSDPRPEYLLFIGDDNLPEPDALIGLMERINLGDRKLDAMGGLYFQKKTPPLPVAWRGRNVLSPEECASGDIYGVTGQGLDFVLIRTSVFDRIDLPYFKTVQTEMQLLTEDAYFWRKAYEAGVRGYVATGVRVGHYDWKENRAY